MNDNNSTNNDSIWYQGILILLFSLVFLLAGYLLLLLVALQFLTKALTRDLNTNLQQLDISLVNYIIQILNYLTLQTSTPPFPFQPFPTHGNNTLSAQGNESEDITKIRGITVNVSENDQEPK